MDNQKSKHDTFNEHPVNPKILDILIQTIIYLFRSNYFDYQAIATVRSIMILHYYYRVSDGVISSLSLSNFQLGCAFA